MDRMDAYIYEFCAKTIQNEFVIIAWCVSAEVIVMLVPCEGSETYVNGKRVEDSIQLRSGMFT